jgi:hypothetical protein
MFCRVVLRCSVQPSVQKSSVFLRVFPASSMVLLAALLVFGLTSSAIRIAAYRAHSDALSALEGQAERTIAAVDNRIRFEADRLRSLAASHSILRRDFQAFHTEASAFGKQHRRQVVLLDVVRNTQIINTAHAFGAYLEEGARFMQPGEITRAVADTPYVSNVFYAPLAKKNLVAVAVPVVEEGRATFMLGVPLDLLEFHALLKAATPAANIMTALIDRNGVIIARSAENERYAGRAAPSNVNQRPEKKGRFDGVALDGTPISIAYVQSEFSGWASVSMTPNRDLALWAFVIASITALGVLITGILALVWFRASRRRIPSGPPDNAL